MDKTGYLPIYEIGRGNIPESLHYGSIAVVNSQGDLIAWYGEPKVVTFMRSTAKPLQALPFIESGGHEKFSLHPSEIALICASHNGTDKHVSRAVSIQTKAGVQETDLLCGTHPPIDEATSNRLRERGEEPTCNRHNCSGKHTGMLAFAQMNGWSKEDYLELEHPVQQAILKSIAEMCSLSVDQIVVGIDGCSAPNFAVPLEKAALAFARLVDPSNLSTERAAACKTITSAMTSYPDMVAGEGRFDTHLMETTNGRIIAKAGAEGYQGLGIFPGTIAPDSPGLGITIKISDGDIKNRARPAVCLEILRQLGALTSSDLKAFSDFGPTQPVRNWRKLQVGEARPCFSLSGVS
ncbi:MAG: asparaginase [Anaerolineales bacterium]